MGFKAERGIALYLLHEGRDFSAMKFDNHLQELMRKSGEAAVAYMETMEAKRLEFAAE